MIRRKPRVQKPVTRAHRSHDQGGVPAEASEARKVRGKQLRIVSLTFRMLTTKKLVGALERAMELTLGAHVGPAVVTLPGVQNGTPEDWSAIVASRGRQHSASVLFEEWTEDSRRYRFFDIATGRVRANVRQLFTEARFATPTNVGALIAQLNDPERRTFEAGSARVGLIVCGENNVLTNIQRDSNRAVIRHGFKGQLLPHADVVFNGAHTVMGNWGKLERRFELLSRGRLMLYATNNDKQAWRSSVRAYRNGVIVADGDRVHEPEDARVSLVKDPTHDAFRAICVDLA